MINLLRCRFHKLQTEVARAISILVKNHPGITQALKLSTAGSLMV